MGSLAITRHQRRSIAAPMPSAIETESAIAVASTVTGTAAATIAIVATATIPGIAGTTATTTQEGLTLSRGAGVAEDGESSN